MKTVTVFLLIAAALPAQKPLTNRDVIDLSHRLPISRIIDELNRNPSNFDVSPSGLIALHAAGLSTQVVDEMLAISARSRNQNSFGVLGASFPIDEAKGHTIRLIGWIRTDNATDGYAGLWLRVDSPQPGKLLAFDNSQTRTIDGESVPGNGEVRGATGTAPWTRYQIELPVAASAAHIAFGAIFTGIGSAWFDALSIEIDGIPWQNQPRFDFDFELPSLRGFGKNGEGYNIGFDSTTSWTGRQSLRMQSSNKSKADTNPAITNEDVLSMTRAGVPSHNIVTGIQYSPVHFDLSPTALTSLRAAGVDNSVIALMARSSGRAKYANSFGVATGTFPVKVAAGHTIHFGAWIRTENVENGYAAPWWRVDGPERGKPLAFENGQARLIDGQPDSVHGLMRGATGTSTWTRYEFDLPVAPEATNINFGVLFSGTGTVWVDALSILVDGVPYSDPKLFDFGFESQTPKGFYTGGLGYRVTLDNKVSYSGIQSLRMEFIGDGGAIQTAQKQ
jgi:hypothetical protein